RPAPRPATGRRRPRPGGPGAVRGDALGPRRRRPAPGPVADPGAAEGEDPGGAAGVADRPGRARPGAVRRRGPALDRPVHRGAAGAVRGAGGEARVLAVFTFRPEYDPPWKGKAVQTQVALNRLTRGQVAQMMRAQTGEAAIPQAVIDQVVERTDGVPLFVKEFAKLLAEGGRWADGVGAAIPATLQDL